MIHNKLMFILTIIFRATVSKSNVNCPWDGPWKTEEICSISACDGFLLEKFLR